MEPDNQKCVEHVRFLTRIDNDDDDNNVTRCLQTFPLEYPVFMREHHNAMYRIWIYYICKMLAEVSINNSIL